MATHETHRSLSKRPIPLSLIGKTCRIVMNLGWVTFIAWMVLLLLSGISRLFEGSTGIARSLQQAVGNMTADPWNSSNEAKKLFYFFNIQSLMSLSAERWQDIIAKTKTVLDILLPVTQLIYLRCKLFLLSSPLLLSMACLGLLDGLAQRDIRKYQSTRESSLFFHRSKAFLLFFFYSSYFLLIGIPVAFNWNIALLLMAILLGILIAISSQHFKKYL